MLRKPDGNDQAAISGARIAAFWLPSQAVLYVGATPTSIPSRVRALRETPLGERRPHSGGHWLHVLKGLEHTRIWWAATDAVEEYEDALLGAFGEGVSATERAALPDSDVVLPVNANGTLARTRFVGRRHDCPLGQY